MAKSIIINGVTYENVPSVTIPLAAQGTSITWDGDTTGKESFYSSGYNYYKVSDQYISTSVVATSSLILHLIEDGDISALRNSAGAEVSGIYVITSNFGEGMNMNTVCVLSAGNPFSVSPGIYFAQDSGFGWVSNFSWSASNDSDPNPGNAIFYETSDGNVPAEYVMENYTAYTSSGKITGTMPYIGEVTQTITTQGGQYTIPRGYHDGDGKVTAQITASTLTNDIISGQAVEEATGDYAWKSTVQIPAGYHNAQTLEKTFSSIFPAPGTPGTSADVLLGKQFYDKDGKLVTGTMTNNGAVTSTISSQGGTYTIPAGYHNGSGVVTASINAGVITSGAGSAEISAPSYNSTTGKFTQTASGTVAAPTVGTAGYVSSTTGTKNTNTISGSTTLDKISIKSTISGVASAVTPVISKINVPSGVTDGSDGTATTTAPSSGVYVAIASAANTGTLTAAPGVLTAGYGTTVSGQYTATNATATVGANASANTYVKVKTGSATPSTSLSSTYLTTTDTGYAVTATPSASVTAGWVASASAGSAVTQYINVEDKSVTPSSSQQVITPSTGKLIKQVTVEAAPVVSQDSTTKVVSIV